MNIKIAVTQFRLRPYKSFNDFIEHVNDILNKARDADIIVFGEWFTLGLLNSLTDKPNHNDIKRLEEYTDTIIEFFSKEAKKRGQTIVAGTTVEHDKGYYDTCFVFGDKLYKHRKTHLFPLEKEVWGLDEYDEINTIPYNDTKLGICICYESQIPECSRALVSQGAEILICPSFTITHAGYNRIRYSCHARCIENQIVMILSSTIGDLGFVNGVGKSAILSPCDKPWNDNGIIVECSNEIAYAEIDVDDIRLTREEGNAKTHKDRSRRLSLYKKWLYV